MFTICASRKIEVRIPNDLLTFKLLMWKYVVSCSLQIMHCTIYYFLVLQPRLLTYLPKAPTKCYVKTKTNLSMCKTPHNCKEPFASFPFKINNRALFETKFVSFSDEYIIWFTIFHVESIHKCIGITLLW